MGKNEASVQTPAGTIIARACNDPGYPGIDIILVDKEGVETPLALVEHIPGVELCTGPDHIPGDVIPRARITETQGRCVLTPGLMARVWNEADREDPISIAYAGLTMLDDII